MGVEIKSWILAVEGTVTSLKEVKNITKLVSDHGKDIKKDQIEDTKLTHADKNEENQIKDIKEAHSNDMKVDHPLNSEFNKTKWVTHKIRIYLYVVNVQRLPVHHDCQIFGWKSVETYFKKFSRPLHVWITQLDKKFVALITYRSKMDVDKLMRTLKYGTISNVYRCSYHLIRC